MVNYQLLGSFLEHYKEYTYGFEAGVLWCRMSSNNEAVIETTTRVGNREAIRNMADALGWTVVTQPTCVEGYDFTTLTKESKPERKLALVGNTDGPSA